MTAAMLLVFAFLAAETSARAVNISNVWFLPQEGFPVFYRYFRDRVTWFEADAVCQFHHGNLVTVASSKQYDTSRAYLKELDIVDNVWIGLKKKASNEKDYKTLDDNGGYWQEKIPESEADLCAAIDPAADFRWHCHNCGVPPWAKKADGCLLTALPSLTVTYLPEQATVELTSDCGLDGTRRIACKGQADHSEMMRQLSCENSSESDEEDKPVSASSTTLDMAESHQSPTRHRREADNTTTRTVAETTIANNLSHATSAPVVTSTATMPSANPETTSAPDKPVTIGQFVTTRSQEIVLLTDKPTSAQSTQTSITTSPYVNTKTGPYFSTGIQETVSATAKSGLAKFEDVVTEMKQFSTNTMTNVEGESTQAEIQPTKIPLMYTNMTTIKNDVTTNLYRESTQPEILQTQTPLISTNVITGKSAAYKNSEGVTTHADLLQTQTPLMIANITTSKGMLKTTTHDYVEDLSNTTKSNDEITATKVKNTTENRRRQLLPTPLRDLPPEEETETSDLESSSQRYDNAQLVPIDTEVPVKPNRGRHLTHPQGHSFYPYFLNRVLG
ncbi:hypothetical protein C0J52_00397 [Blattella germanica]|nr:hypothetical protein C0J52_00397 [Blattella germanica]